MQGVDVEPFVQLSTRIPKELHRRLKLFSVSTGVSQMRFVWAALEEKLAKRSVGQAGRWRARRRLQP